MSKVDVVVEVVLPVGEVVWPVVVPVGRASAKAAGVDRKRAMVTAEIATPPTPARVVQLSEY